MPATVPEVLLHDFLSELLFPAKVMVEARMTIGIP